MTTTKPDKIITEAETSISPMVRRAAKAKTLRRSMHFCDNCLAMIYYWTQGIMDNAPVHCADCQREECRMTDAEYEKIKADQAPPARIRRNLARLQNANKGA